MERRNASVVNNRSRYGGNIMTEELTTQESIDLILTNFAEFLKEKNRLYGDSALVPLNMFSKLPAGEGIRVRLDDKASRIIHSGTLRKNDIADLVGYLVLLMIHEGYTTFDELLD